MSCLPDRHEVARRIAAPSGGYNTGDRNKKGRTAMNLGLVDERLYQTLMHDREAHAAWVTAHAWHDRTPRRRNWRQTVAAAPVALATRIAPSVTMADIRTRAPVH
jgi:hypothetical protein